MIPAPTSYAAYQFYFNVFQFVFMAAVAIYTFWTNREKITKARFDEQGKDIAEIKNKLGSIPTGCSGHASMTGRLDGHNDRLEQHKQLINTIETDLKHLPKTDDLAKIHEKINGVSNQMAEIRSDVSKIAGGMPGLVHITEMMNEYLLNKGGK